MVEPMKRLLEGLLVLAVLVSIAAGLAGRLNELLPVDMPTSLALPRTVVAPARYVDAADQDANAPIHVHITEQTKEVEDCLAW